MNCGNAVTVGFGTAVGNFSAGGAVETFNNIVDDESVRETPVIV